MRNHPVPDAAEYTLLSMMNPLHAAPPVSVADLNYILENNATLWEELRGRRIFITGGTGFFGCWLLESFIAANAAFDLRAHAVVLTRSARRFRERAPHLAGNPAVELLEGDVRTFAFPDGEFPFVIHAATESVRTSSANPLATDPSTELLSTILEGTQAMPGVRRISWDIEVSADQFRSRVRPSAVGYDAYPRELSRRSRPSELKLGLRRRQADRRNAVQSCSIPHADGMQDCPMFCIRRSASSVERTFCRWKFYSRRHARWAHRDSRRWNTHALLYVCGRPGAVVMDYVISC